MERPIKFLRPADFVEIAHKVKERGLKIGAMFCFGEPLADRDLFNKIEYGRQIGVMTNYLGLNTNASLLRPEVFDKIFQACSNITLSFPNVGSEFERLTGLKWERCYKNAIEFIRYRDKNKPGFKVEIGCNEVTGADEASVRKAFAGYRVEWAKDAEIKWGGKIITGVIDRSIMYHSWTCDGYKGAMQIKPNGDCCFCAYDVIRGETNFANILKDDWETIEANFKKLWRRPSSLCLRCDFWWNYYQVKAAGWRRGDHIDSSWQAAYRDGIKSFWENNHQKHEIRFLTGSSISNVANFLGFADFLRPGMRILNIGLGTGRCSKELNARDIIVDGLDISRNAIENCLDYIDRGFTDPRQLPSRQYDLAICNLVAQHASDIDLIVLMQNVLRSLKDNAPLAIQYASPPNGNREYDETLERQRMGTVQRTPEHFERLVDLAGGRVISKSKTRSFEKGKATDDNLWNGAQVARVRDIKQIGTR